MTDVVEIPAEYQFVREPWRDWAACDGVDSAMFFPERGEPTEPAKLICWACPVKTECLTWALDNFVKVGIYGGRSERERRRMRRERRAAARRGEVFVISPIDQEPRLPIAYRRPRLRPAQGLATPLRVVLPATYRHARPTHHKGAGFAALLRVAA